MLQTAAIKVSLEEPRGRFLEMARCIKSFGTEKIYLIHVPTTQRPNKRAKIVASLRELADSIRELDFTVEIHLRQGQIATEIVDFSRELGVDFICIYWIPKGALRNILLGSIDSDILRMSSLPVFVYNRKWYQAPARIYDRVLYATDFQATDSRVMPYLQNKNFKADTLFILHVGERAPDPYAEKRRLNRVYQDLQRLADECRQAYSQVETIEVVGRPKSQIVRQARMLKVELIVIGKSDKPKPLEQLMGSTAEAIPHKAKCSVFIIPGVGSR